jgi:TRAP-type C4-dicarboxylate transport system substrate-binding protein
MKTRLAVIGMAAMLSLGVAHTASAETKWDLPLAWPANNYIVQSAQRFADEVKSNTGGEVVITLHPGGSLGYKGPEMLSAVRDGLVPIGDMLINLQVGDEPLLGLQSLPYLIGSFEELRVFDGLYRSLLNEIFTKNNQKLLYTIPWPQQQIYTKKKIESVADLANIKIRSYDKSSTEIFSAAKMVPVQLPWGEVIPSLAAGAIDAVATSSPSAVDGAFWEFLKYGYPTRQTWNSNAMTVNIDAWKKLPAKHQEAISRVAAKLEGMFWDTAQKTDSEQMATLAKKGLVNGTIDNRMRADLNALGEPLRKKSLAGLGTRAAEVVKQFENRPTK